ncbi:MAG TPA: histidine phosphatase family protein [Solirubrobacteraceae bacterium]
MPTIQLIRHGQASFGGPDYDVLSEGGRMQSLLLARELANRETRVELIVSGSLRRQYETAEPSATLLEREVLVDTRWNEYDMDEILTHHSSTRARTHQEAGAEPVSSAEFQDVLEDGLAAWIEAGPSSPARESWPAFAGRITTALGELAAELSPGSTGLVFTSGGVVAALCSAALKYPDQSLLAFNRVSVNTGITKLVTGRRGLTLVSFNEHGHLERTNPPLISYR